jgi:hypothetical protein
MAKKTGANKVEAIAQPRKRTGHAVRLDLNAKDNDRLERCAEEMGLTKASFARMAVLAMIRQREERAQ